MTPEQKANELIDKFMLYSVKKIEISKETMQYEFNYKIKRELAIECTIIAVDEIINAMKMSYHSISLSIDIAYWLKVKNELETLKN